MMKKNRPLIWLLLIIIVLGSAAFQVREKGRKAGPDWSRSIPRGASLRGDIDMAVEPDGRLIHLVWLHDVEDRNRVHYQQLNDMADSQVDLDLDLPDTQLRIPHILPTGGDNQHLLWLSRPDGQREWALHYVQIDQNGELAANIIELASSEQDVAEFTTVSDGQGGFYIAWESSAEGAVYGSHIAADGKLLQDTSRLVDQGSHPSLAADSDNLYMTWIDRFDVMYASWPQGEIAATTAESLGAIPLGLGKDINGPVIGVAGDWAYVIWSIFNSSGLEAGTAFTEYITFPKDSPQRLNAQRLLLSPDEEPTYGAYESAYQITQLASPPGASGSTDFVYEPDLAASLGDELAVVVAMNQDYRLNTLTQIGMVIFKDGQYEGYQMTGKTEAFSQAPTLDADAAGNLYVAWREGGRGGVAYYALTSPAAREKLDSFRSNDMVNVALSGGMEALVGVLFFPLACIWLIPGLLLIGLWHFWRGDSDLHDKATIVVLVVSIVVSQIMKFLFMPTITTYVPFSAWFDVSPRWELPLLLIVPVITMLVGLLVAWFMRRRTPSGLAFFFWFTISDALLTLAIYGVTILGVF